MARLNFLLIYVLFSWMVISSAQGQSVGIGTTTPNPHAILHIVTPNNNQGILLPSLTTLQRLSMPLSSPGDAGLIVFDTNEGMFYFWNKGSWHRGMGDAATNANLSYDAANKILSVSGGSSVDLSSLSDNPAAMNIPVTTIAGVTGTNVQQILESLNSKINGLPSPSVDKFAINNAVRNISLSLAGDGVPDKVINLNKIPLQGIVSGTLDNTKIADGLIVPKMLQAGSPSQIVITDGSGKVVWDDYPVAGDLTVSAITGITGTDVQQVLEELNDKIAASTSTVDNFTVDAPNRNIALSLAGDAVPDNIVNLDNIPLSGIVTGKLSNTQIADSKLTPAMMQPGSNGQVLMTDGSGNVSWQETSVFSLLGAVADGSTISGGGTLLSPLRIKPSGTGDQVLMTNGSGNGIVWRDRYNNSTEYYSVDPSDFVAVKSENEEDKPGITIYETDGTFITSTKKDKNQVGMASLHFQQDAILKELIVYYLDDINQDINVYLLRKEIGTQTQSILAFFSSNGSVSTIRNKTISLNETIDNSQYTYRLVVVFDSRNDVHRPSEAKHRLYGARIEYDIQR